MTFTIRMTPFMRQQLYRRLPQAYASGSRRLVKRIHALLAILPRAWPCGRLRIGWPWRSKRAATPSTVFSGAGVARWVSQRPSGRPAKLTKTPRHALAAWIAAGPQAPGSALGGWRAAIRRALIQRQFGVEYHPHYSCPWLPNLSVAYQTARFVSDHLDAAKRLEWWQQTWPTVLRRVRHRKALLLFGDAASFAQWSSLRYPWARQGHQPAVQTRGIRQAYKVCGRIDYVSGRLFAKAHMGRFNTEISAAFLRDVLAPTTQHIFVIQDGARAPTSQTMEAFVAAHATRLTKVPWPASAPDCNPIEYLWKKVKKMATHLTHFPALTLLQTAGDKALLHFAQTPHAIIALMTRYCDSLGALAASWHTKLFLKTIDASSYPPQW